MMENHDQQRHEVASRKQMHQEQIQKEHMEGKKAEAEEMDQQYAELVSIEENKELEAQKKKQQEQAEKDTMAMKLVEEFPDLDYQIAYNMLQERRWDFNSTQKVLKEQRDTMRKQEEKME